MVELLGNQLVILSLIVALVGVTLILLVLVIINHVALKRLSRKYDLFMRNTSDGLTLEDLLYDLIKETRDCSSKQTVIDKRLDKLDSQIETCFQKFGVVRYNPFEDTGGDLSYVIAILDNHDSGVLLNGIYNRDGSYTYAKLINNGACTKHKLSSEELEALNIAKGSK